MTELTCSKRASSIQISIGSVLQHQWATAWGYRMPQWVENFTTRRMKNKAALPQEPILVYQTEDGLIRVDVRMDASTVWLSQAQMAELFDTSRPNVTQHIRNVFNEGELVEAAVCKDFLLTAADGKQYNTRHYNLDVIISVGYRVKSLRGTQFRIWATKLLNEYLTKGFTLDDKRLKESSYLDRYFDELTERRLAEHGSDQLAGRADSAARCEGGEELPERR